MSKLTADKEARMKSTQDLNKEMAAINRTIQLATTRASAAEKAASEKESQYSAFGSNDKARSEIREGIGKCNSNEAEYREAEAPLRQEIGKAEGEKTRLRDTAGVEEAKKSGELSKYAGSLGDVAGMNANVSKFNPKAKLKVSSPEHSSATRKALYETVFV